MRSIGLLLLRIGRPFANAFYALYKLLPPRHKVTLLSRQHDRPSVDFEMIRSELRRQDRTLKVVVITQTIRPGVKGKLAYIPALLRQMFHVASSKAVVVDGYSIVVSYLKQRRSLFVLQIWHSPGAFKRFSLQTLDKPGGRKSDIASVMRMHQNYSAVLCGGMASRPIYAEALGVGIEQVYPIPLPRIDLLRDPDINRMDQVLRHHPELRGAGKTVLYVPTFRDRASGEQSRLALDSLAQACEQVGYTLVMKAHVREQHLIRPAGSEPVSGVVKSDLDVVDLIAVSDHVVTDYSGVAFEAAAARKPVWFYLYDIDTYVTERGLNVDPREEMPDSCYTNAHELVSAMASVEVPSGDQNHFTERFLANVVGGATPAIVRLIRKGMR